LKSRRQVLFFVVTGDLDDEFHDYSQEAGRKLYLFHPSVFNSLNLNHKK
jgi:hypothetical protein